MRTVIASALIASTAALLGACSSGSSSESSSSSDARQNVALNTTVVYPAPSDPQPGTAVLAFGNGVRARASLNADVVSSASGQVTLPTTLAGRFKAPNGAVLVPIAIGLNTSGVTPSAIASSASSKPTITYALRYGSTKIPLTNDTKFATSVIASVPKAQVDNLRIDITVASTTKSVNLLGREAK